MSKIIPHTVGISKNSGKDINNLISRALLMFEQ